LQKVVSASLDSGGRKPANLPKVSRLRRQKGNLANWHGFGGGQLLMALVVPPEMQICTSALTPPLPYVFEAAQPSLLRLLTRSAEAGSASQVLPARVSVLSTRAIWQGQTWTGVRWPRSTWTDTRELIGSAHSTRS